MKLAQTKNNKTEFSEIDSVRKTEMKEGISNVEALLIDAIRKVTDYVGKNKKASAFSAFEHYMHSREFSRSNLKYNKMVSEAHANVRKKLLSYPRTTDGTLFGHVRVRKNTEKFYFDINFYIADERLFFINFATAEPQPMTTLPEDIYEQVHLFVCDPGNKILFVPSFTQKRSEHNQLAQTANTVAEKAVYTPSEATVLDEEDESRYFPHLLAVLNASEKKNTPKKK